jgi:hypothetical protein
MLLKTYSNQNKFKVSEMSYLCDEVREKAKIKGFQKRIKQSLHKNFCKPPKNITPSDAAMSPINKSACNILSIKM